LSRRKKTVGLDLGTSRVAVIIAESDEGGGAVSVVGVGAAVGFAPGDGLGVAGSFDLNASSGSDAFITLM